MNRSILKGLRFGAAVIAAGLLVSPFTNCGTYSTDGLTSSLDDAALTCTTDNCITPSLDNLALKVNLGGGSDHGVLSGEADFNLGGDCNEGGYAQNYIIWELFYQGVKIRDSNMAMAGQSNVNSKCVNGRFLIYINLAPIAQDPTNRTGLSVGATRSPYDLYVEILVQDTFGAPVLRNEVTGRTHVNLLPLNP